MAAGVFSGTDQRKTGHRIFSRLWDIQEGSCEPVLSQNVIEKSRFLYSIQFLAREKYLHP